MRSSWIKPRLGKDNVTQMNFARNGHITEEMDFVAKKETLPEEIFKKAEFCSMCGPKHCPMNSKISDESLDQLKDKLEGCNTNSSV